MVVLYCLITYHKGIEIITGKEGEFYSMQAVDGGAPSAESDSIFIYYSSGPRFCRPSRGIQSS